MLTLIVKTDRRTQFLDVTAQVQKAVSAAKISNGICYLYVPHTTAGITINECADPDVARDIEGALDRLIPKTGPYRHSEGNSDSHIKSVLVGGRNRVRRGWTPGVGTLARDFLLRIRWAARAAAAGESRGRVIARRPGLFIAFVRRFLLIGPYSELKSPEVFNGLNLRCASPTCDARFIKYLTDFDPCPFAMCECADGSGGIAR